MLVFVTTEACPDIALDVHGALDCQSSWGLPAAMTGSDEDIGPQLVVLSQIELTYTMPLLLRSYGAASSVAALKIEPRLLALLRL